MSGKGHNSGPVNVSKLKDFVERLDSIDVDEDAIKADRRRIYDEAKGVGFNPKAMRKIMAERKRKTDAELEADMDLYRDALSMPGATYRSVAKQLGVPKSTLQRRVPRNANGTEIAHDPITGVIAEPSSDAHPRRCDACGADAMALLHVGEQRLCPACAPKSSSESCGGGSDEDLQTLPASAAARGVPSGQEGFDRRQDLGVQALHEGASKGAPYSRPAPVPVEGERLGARPSKGRGEVRTDDEAGSVSAVPSANAAPFAGRPPSRLHASVGSNLAMPSLSRTGVADLETGGIGACGSTEGRTATGMRAADPGDASSPRAAQAGVEPGPQDATTTGGEGDEQEDVSCARQEGRVRGQSDAEDAGGNAASVRGLGDGQDDHQEDGGGVRGQGAAQDQLSEAQPTVVVDAVEPSSARVARPYTDADMEPPPFLDQRHKLTKGQAV